MLTNVGTEIGDDDIYRRPFSTGQTFTSACATLVFYQHGDIEHMRWKSMPEHLLDETQQAEDTNRASNLEVAELLPKQFTVLYLPRFVNCQHHVRVVDLADIKLRISNGHNKAVEISEKQRPPLVPSCNVEMSR
jgi:hypothetical protein